MLIIGVQKCGTGTLRFTCSQHPQIRMTQRKELHFFDRHFDRGLPWYEQQVGPADGHDHVGEATPDYIYDPVARARMTTTLPTTKFVVVLRDPATRAYSHYWHTRRKGWEDETFEQALELEPERLRTDDVEQRSRYSYVDRGHYVDQLLDLEATHDRSMLHVLLLDDLRNDHVATLEALFRFLEVDEAQARAIPPQWRNRPRERDPELGRNVQVEYPPISPDTRADLVERFRESNRRLGTWLGRDLSSWDRV